MKKTMTLNFKEIKSYSSDWLEEIIKNRRKLILTVIYVIGLWCGTKLYIGYSVNLQSLFSTTTQLIVDKKIAIVFIVLLFLNLFPILNSFFNGFFAFGMPASMFSPCILSVLIGITNAWIYSNYGINGVFFVLLSIVPFAISETIILLISCNESIALSGQLAKLILLKDTSERGEVKEFFTKHLIIISLCVVITITQTIVIVNLCSKLLI